MQDQITPRYKAKVTDKIPGLLFILFFTLLALVVGLLGNNIAWFIFIFFSILLIYGLISIIFNRLEYIELREDGFIVSSFRKKRFLEYADLEGFYTDSKQDDDLYVYFDFNKQSGKSHQVSRQIGGHDELLTNTYGFTAKELANKLNSARLEYFAK